jgi:hypothetical protein
MAVLNEEFNKILAVQLRLRGKEHVRTTGYGQFLRGKYLCPGISFLWLLVKADHRQMGELK